MRTFPIINQPSGKIINIPLKTVGDVIAELSKLDGDMPVCGSDHDGFPSLEIIEIEVVTDSCVNPLCVIS